MGRKHSKNAGVMGSEALTYHERRALGWTNDARERLGKVRCEPRRGKEGNRKESLLHACLYRTKRMCCRMFFLTFVNERIEYRSMKSDILMHVVGRALCGVLKGPALSIEVEPSHSLCAGFCRELSRLSFDSIPSC